jgi:hypothetical protein
MIRLREEMQTEKPTMLNCEELIRGLEKIDGKSTNSEDDWGLDSENE